MRFRDSVRRWLAVMFLVGCAVQSGISGRAAEPAAAEKREVIGTVLDKPVYRDQLRRKDSPESDLHQLFIVPVMTEYRKKHEADVTPSAAEIEAAAAFFDQKHCERIKDKEPELRQKLKEIETRLDLNDLPAEERQELEAKKASLEARLRPPGNDFAEFMLNHWKFQRHLYDKYGGGRILWQQGGTEAFDAMRTWPEAEEKNGAIQFHDAALRTKFYEYWTTKKHGAFLTADKGRIRREFLEPEWAPALPK